MSEYKPDPMYAETKVKNPGTSKGRKGNVAPKTVSVPNLIVEGTYVQPTSAGNSNSGGPGTKGRAGWKAKYKTGSPDGQNVKYQPPKNVGKMLISDLPGQYTGVPKSGGR
jgi:hypothetical protein